MNLHKGVKIPNTVTEKKTLLVPNGSGAKCNTQLSTIEDLAKVFGCSERTVMRKVASGTLPQPAIQVGKKVWVLDEVMSFLCQKQREHTELVDQNLNRMKR